MVGRITAIFALRVLSLRVLVLAPMVYGKEHHGVAVSDGWMAWQHEHQFKQLTALRVLVLAPVVHRMEHYGMMDFLSDAAASAAAAGRGPKSNLGSL